MIDLSRLREIIQYEGGINRRLFLAYSSALASIPLLGNQAQGRLRRTGFANDPFTLGVASGDPNASGFVLWTRLAPEPLEPGGGLGPDFIEVNWEVATDDQLKNLVRRGKAIASPQLAHSVHVELEGLDPDRPYWYRFQANDAESPIGRTRTMPRPRAEPDQLKFAFASCQHYETGLYTAYEHMAKDDLDLVVHLGDYIYEYAGQGDRVREHAGPKITTLEDFRIRHAQYKTDEHLQRMHALCPWLVTWDDHEVENNYADDISERLDFDPVDFLVLRANAYQAYYEMMPLRRRALPRGPEMQLYRKVSFGRLAEFLVLDTRQYRSDQPNDDKLSPLNADALDKQTTMLGARQSGWLKASLLQSTANWNIMAQGIMMGMANFNGDYSMDQWPGYAHERMELLRWIQERKVPNPVVLTGDIHSNWVNDLRVDDREMDKPIVATEFVGTSISSGGNGDPNPKGLEDGLAANPFVRFFNAQRGYVRCTVTPDSWRSDYQVVEDVIRPGAPAVTKGSFVVESGTPGAKPA